MAKKANYSALPLSSLALQKVRGIVAGMNRLYRLLLILFLLLTGATAASGREQTILASWNVMRLGHGDHKDYETMGRIANRFDLIALQEVMTEDGLAKLEAAVEEASGEAWASMASHRIGRGSYKEMYAFLWRESAVEYVDGAVVYLDQGDRFAREPYSARFRSKALGLDFVVATVHILYGKSKADREPEIRVLREYWNWVGEVYADTPARFLVGDFNLPPSDRAWEPLKRTARAAIQRGGSTLSSIDGRFANLYDNIWVPRDHQIPMSSGDIYTYPRSMGLTHEVAR
jgi:endonuclease/exonuclease/phosphatase family metal-dependent hydrolase